MTQKTMATVNLFLFRNLW